MKLRPPINQIICPNLKEMHASCILKMYLNIYQSVNGEFTESYHHHLLNHCFTVHTCQSQHNIFTQLNKLTQEFTIRNRYKEHTVDKQIFKICVCQNV